jgi:hypothetical protein
MVATVLSGRALDSFGSAQGDVSMIIAGGCYHEVCEHPRWRAILGSGGRAAFGLSALIPDLELKTYYPADRLADLYPIEASGVKVHAAASTSPIAFAYFHTLSDPVISPMPSQITPLPPVRAEGDVVLRFGFLEGSAVVNADRAIYDPQSAGSFDAFAHNGSRASELAMVLNERELCASENSAGVEDAARRIISSGEASVLIAKGGIKGARLFDANNPTVFIPAYRSSRVFKIGTGDVFSAAFAFYWGQERVGAREAAELASRSVAHYCDSAHLPLPAANDLLQSSPVGSLAFRPICIAGSPATLGGRWVLEEARWRLQQLGLQAVAPSLDGGGSQTVRVDGFGCLLVLTDHLDDTAAQLIASAGAVALPIIAFGQFRDALSPSLVSPSNVTADFTTALYWASWAAAQH